MHDIPRIAKDDPITARWLNRIVDALRSLRIVTDGSILVDRTAGGQVLRLAASGSGNINIYTGSGGIPARLGSTPGKATNVLRLSWVGENLPTAGVTSTVTVYNVSSTAVGPNKYGIAIPVDSRYEVVVESCG